MLSCSLPPKQLQGSNRLKLKSVTEFGNPSTRDIVFNSSATYITQLGCIVSFISPSFPSFSVHHSFIFQFMFGGNMHCSQYEHILSPSITVILPAWSLFHNQITLLYQSNIFLLGLCVFNQYFITGD